VVSDSTRSRRRCKEPEVREERDETGRRRRDRDRSGYTLEQRIDGLVVDVVDAEPRFPRKLVIVDPPTESGYDTRRRKY
jgi:hypothetical protein